MKTIEEKYFILRKLALDMYSGMMLLSTDITRLRESMEKFYRYINFEERRNKYDKRTNQ